MITTTMSNYTLKSTDMILEESGMRNYFEDHIGWLRSNSELHRVEPMDAYVYKHDLAAYLFKENIDAAYHWIYMRVNGFHYNWEFNDKTEFLYFPDGNAIEELISQYSLLTSK